MKYRRLGHTGWQISETRGIATGWLAVLSMLLSATPVLAQNLEPMASLAIERVTIIDPTAEPEENARVPDQTVLIAGNRNEHVGPADTIIRDRACRRTR